MNEFVNDLFVTSHILFELFSPKLDPRLRRTAFLATRVRVPVPKTSVHEDDFLLNTKNKVWCTWEVFPVQAIPKAHCMYHSTNEQLGSSILTLYVRHQTTTLIAVHSVGHSWHPSGDAYI